MWNFCWKEICLFFKNEPKNAKKNIQKGESFTTGTPSQVQYPKNIFYNTAWWVYTTKSYPKSKNLISKVALDMAPMIHPSWNETSATYNK